MSNLKICQSETFCVLPWTHAATYTDGSVLLCCVAKKNSQLNLNRMSWPEIWNSDHFKQARLLMLSGKQFPACQSCFDEEKAGIKSHRQNENGLWTRHLGESYIQDLVSKTKADGTIDNNIITVDFRLGNTCNLQCVMCRPQDSSKWLRDAKILANELVTDAKYDWKYKAEINLEDFDWYKKKEFWESFYESCDKIKHMIFAGGEPLYIKEQKEIIKQLVTRGFSKNIAIRYHTNGTIYDKELVELWTHFRNVEIMISIDGYDWVNSYIRYPADWSLISKNLELYDKSPAVVDPKILCTVQALNIFWLPEFCEWLFNQNFEKISARAHHKLFHPGILHWPQYLNTKVLPKDKKQAVSKKLLAYCEKYTDNPTIIKLTKLVDFMNNEDYSNNYNQTLEYLGKIDQLHGTNYKPLLDIG